MTSDAPSSKVSGVTGRESTDLLADNKEVRMTSEMLNSADSLRGKRTIDAN